MDSLQGMLISCMSLAVCKLKSLKRRYDYEKIAMAYVIVLFMNTLAVSAFSFGPGLERGNVGVVL
jgi:hypothetical protein